MDIVSEEYEYIENEYSVTEILNGIREIKLTRKYYNVLTKDVSDMVARIFGTAMHYLLEIKDKHNITEYKLKAEVKNGLYLKGRFDAYNKNDYTLIDYKTCKAYKVIKGDFSDWRKQGLMYAWLCKKNGLYVDKVRFIAMIKDYSINTKLESGIYVYEFKVNALDLQDIERYIYEKFELLESDYNEPCNEEERWARPTKWACMKNNRKRAVKLFDTKAEAEEFSCDYIEERVGEDIKCDNYCDVKYYCDYWKGKNEV